MTLRVFSLFAGIGGIDLGLQWAGGFHTTGVCEIEPFQRALLAQHFPEAIQYQDIHTVEHVDCDVIVGGFPCQCFSTASRGRRVAANLWPQMFRVVATNKPKYVIAENVSEHAIKTARDDLAGIGYSVTIKNISGTHCGAPHARSRWWAIAHPHADCEFQRTLDAEVAKLPELCRGLWGADNYARALRIPSGIPHRLHRVEALGNAVIPKIPQVIGQTINRMIAKDSLPSA